MNKSWLVGLLLPLILLLGVSCAPLDVAAAPPTQALAATPAPAPPASVITEIRYYDTIQDTATIAWRTSVPTTGRVEYGRTNAYDQASPWSTQLSTYNVVTLGGLDLFETYWVRLRVRDAAGNETVSKGELIFIYWDQADQPWNAWSVPGLVVSP